MLDFAARETDSYQDIVESFRQCEGLRLWSALAVPSEPCV